VPTTVVVQAAGAVAHPGVYHLPAGARVADLVSAAGGATTGADLQAVTLAGRLNDGQRVVVPTIGQPLPDTGPPTTRPTPVDLNTATQAELEALPGIGPATALAILSQRERHGPFRTVDDLLDVPGIGPAKLDAFRDLVRV
jgi:competence protein ComEA